LLILTVDSTAKVWAVDTTSVESLARMSTSPMALLQHSCFVYSAQFHPRDRNPSIVITGAFDGMIRVWNSINGEVHISVSIAVATVFLTRSFVCQ
jgi:WD40 repeat protein